MADLPPVVSVLIDEGLEELSSPEQAEKSLKAGLLRDLKKQAGWTFSNFLYRDHEDRSPGVDFLITASGAVNPLGSSGACDELSCRLRSAKTFAGTVGLWADAVFVPDVFSAQLLDPPRITKRWIRRFSADVAVLRILLPLVQIGAVQFSNAAFVFCAECQASVPERAASRLVSAFEDDFVFEKGFTSAMLVVRAPTILGESIIELQVPKAERIAAANLVASSGRKRLTPETKRLRRFIVKNILQDHVQDIFLDTLSAQQLHSTIVSGTRTDLLCLKALEEELPDLSEIEEWEQARQITVPWVSDLTVEEIVRLRQSASTALPRFRERIAKALAQPQKNTSSLRRETMSELRAEAAEVEAELRALGSRTRSRGKTAIALLSASVAVYGVAAAGVPALSGVAQLLATLGLIHGYSRTDRTEEAKLKSRPGYVLLKARELVGDRAHAHAG